MDKELFYDDIAEDFDEIMNIYDTNRRIEIIFETFLQEENLKDKTLLDGGCGTGRFTQKAIEKGAIVTAVDISPKLVEITKIKNPRAIVKKASLLNLPFEDNKFDYVISSDVIEHTPAPYKAIDELIRVLKPGGSLVLTVPNRSFWYFSVVLANRLNLRKYQGYENWVHYFQLKKYIKNKEIQIIQYRGLHLFPFVFKLLNPILKFIDELTYKFLSPIMINIAVHGRKK